MSLSEKELLAENERLSEELEQYKDLVEAIRNGAVDALSVNKNGSPNIFSLESSDFVYRVLVEHFPEGALNVSENGVIVYANPSFDRLIGDGNFSSVGLHLSSLVDAGYRGTFEQLFRDSFSGNSRGEIIISYKERTIPVEISFSSLYPRFEGIGVLIKDLSDIRKKQREVVSFKQKLQQQEQELTESKIFQKGIEKFRLMSDIIPQKVWTASPEGYFDYFNKKWLDYSDTPLNELKGWGWKKLIHPEDWPATENTWRASILGGGVYETEHRLLDKKGLYRWHLSRGVAQLDPEGHLVMWVGTSTDIQEKKIFEQELETKVREATIFLQTIFDSSEEVITSFDRNLVFTSINKAGAKLAGLKPEEMVGKSLFYIYPELENGKYHNILLEVLKGGVLHDTETLSILGYEATFDAFYKPLVMDKKVNGILVVARDVTQLISVTKNLQKTKKQMDEQFRIIEQKNQKLLIANAELISFTHIASHDLQEPLRKIIMFAHQIAGNTLTGPSGKLPCVNKVINVAENMRELLGALLDYSSVTQDSNKFEETQLSELLKDVRTKLGPPMLEMNARLTVGDLPTLSVIPLQMTQLFTHLIGNALKFRKEEIPPEINITAKRVSHTNLPPGITVEGTECWSIRIEDNGIGFKETYADKIFQPFQKLHSGDDFSGTGIGLAICRKIVHNHGGSILASSVSGKGAIFHIYLPAFPSAE